MDPDGLRAYLKYMGCDYDLPRETLAALCRALDTRILAIAERSRAQHEETFHSQPAQEAAEPDLGTEGWAALRSN